MPESFWQPPSPLHQDIQGPFGYWSELIFPPSCSNRPKRAPLQSFLQSSSHRRKRGSAFSVRVVKYWNKLPASVVTAPSVNVFKKRLEKVWTEIFPYLPHWPNTQSQVLIYIFLFKRRIHTEPNNVGEPFFLPVKVTLRQVGIFALSLTNCALFSICGRNHKFLRRGNMDQQLLECSHKRPRGC